MDYRGLVLIAGGVGLSVFGFQESSIWGWSNPGIWLCIAGGLVPCSWCSTPSSTARRRR